MSSVTENLGLTLPEDEDTADIIVINENMKIIDASVVKNTEKGAPSGIPTLDESGKVPSKQLPVQPNASLTTAGLTKLNSATNSDDETTAATPKAVKTVYDLANSKAGTGVATQSANGLMSSGDKKKLDGVADNANNYVHPSTHPASMIVEDATHRFTTDSEKLNWNSKAENTLATQSANGLMSSGDKKKLDGVADNANNYVHPATHPASMIVEDSTHRFITDNERSDWNNRETTSGAQTKANNAETNAKNYALGLNTVAIADTRNTNLLPNDYWTGSNKKQQIIDLKLETTVGLPNANSGKYCVLITNVPWLDASGGSIKQIAMKEDGSILVRASSGTGAAAIWGTWAQLETTAGSQAKYDAVQSNLNTHTSNGVIHITSDERTKWNKSQLYKLTEDSGFGTLLVEGADLNTVYSSGFYRVKNPINGPNSANWFYLIINQQGLKECMQIVFEFSTMRQFIRVSDANGTFTAWKQVASLDLVTKSQVGLGNVDNVQQASKVDFDTHKIDITSHVPYAAATGSANTYAITLNPAPTSYVDGMAVTVKINVQNTGASTLNVNGLGAKSIKKSNGNDVGAGNLKAGTPYTLRYNGTNFILQGEGGSGNAQPSDLRQGKTASTDTGDITGTLAVQATGAQTITPGTTDQVKAAGIYDGALTIKGDANLKKENIKKGVSIFGITGDGLAYNAGEAINIEKLNYSPIVLVKRAAIDPTYNQGISHCYACDATDRLYIPEYTGNYVNLYIYDAKNPNKGPVMAQWSGSLYGSWIYGMVEYGNYLYMLTNIGLYSITLSNGSVSTVINGGRYAGYNDSCLRLIGTKLYLINTSQELVCYDLATAKEVGYWNLYSALGSRYPMCILGTDPSGYLYISAGGSNLAKISGTGSVIWNVSVKNWSIGGAEGGIVYSAVRNSLLITTYWNSNTWLEEYDLNGNFMQSISLGTVANRPNYATQTYGIFKSGSSIYVATDDQNSFYVFDEATLALKNGAIWQKLIQTTWRGFFMSEKYFIGPSNGQRDLQGFGMSVKLP